MSIKSYTSVAASNTSLFPENMAPSAVNDGMRTVQADIRSWYTDAEWIDFGDSGISRASAATFKITSDVTTRYLVNRRIKCYDATTLYGVVTASAYSAPDTLITVGLDSGSLTTSLTSVALASLSPTNRSIPTSQGYKGADVASATTVNLSTCGGDFCDVTGTTTITAITSESKGIRRKVRFTGILTLTHNATSLILPGAANITTAANDTAEFISLDGTNWLCFSYTRASGASVIAPTVTGPFIDSTAIIKGSADATKLLRIEVDGFTTGQTRVITPPDYDLGFFCVQRVGTQTGALATGTTTIPGDDTIPQNTEGDQYMSLAITPKSSSNILIIQVTWVGAGSITSNGEQTVALFQDSTASALAAARGYSSTVNVPKTITFTHTMTAGTTSATTFKVRAGLQGAGTTTFNGIGGGRQMGGVMASSISIREYTA